MKKEGCQAEEGTSMGIGPIPGIGAVEPLRPRERGSVLPLDESLEAEARLEEDSYAESGGEPTRGMEGDEEENPEESAAEAAREFGDRREHENGEHRVNFFA